MLFSKPNGEKIRLYVLFENIKLFYVTSFIRFLLPFEILESILPHSVYDQFISNYLAFIYMLYTGYSRFPLSAEDLSALGYDTVCISGVPRNFFRGGGGWGEVQQIQLRIEDRENGDLRFWRQLQFGKRYFISY